ncbi:STP1 protein [Plasmodium ovale wallikeri]|uniref:STP1 protein n=1 Tax=Plasmodium ovale wallikeri TaxID=864142 RepID=A0A1A9APS7_PLAOA|nr:STP1 protein [Plasmodium ovale wallikeri]
MDNKKNNCDDINKVSTRVTNLALLPYKTPILHGIIEIINEFKKNNDDGIDYKKLCEQTSRYVNAQKKCVKDVTTSKGRKFVTNEWKSIIRGVAQTYEKQDVQRLCYYEDDKEVKKKKEVLNIHDIFRKFCIEKKNRLRNSSDMDFEECSNYMSWLDEKKREIQGRDPNYKYIEEYQKYFYIHTNCNYPWLVKGTPDFICRMKTTTRAKEKHGKEKSSVDASQIAPAVNPSTSAVPKKNIHLESSNHSKGDVVPTNGKSTESDHEKTPAKSTSSDHSQGVNNDAESNNPIMMLSGTPVDDPPHVSQSNEDYEYMKFKSLLYSVKNNVLVQNVPHDVHDAFKKKLTTFSNKVLSDMQRESITNITTKAYKYIPPKFSLSKKFLQSLRSQGFQSNISKQKLIPRIPSEQIYPPTFLYSQQVPKTIQPIISYAPTTKSMKKPLPPFRLLLPITTNPPDNNSIIKVEIEPAEPDPSYFKPPPYIRSPFMIYTLVFLTLFTIITLFYLLSKYTSFGLYFGKKKKKKKRIKHQLQLKKLPEEVPHSNTIDNYSINDTQRENKIHSDKDIYNQINIQKCTINKNIILRGEKKNGHKTIIDIHMELLNECKNDAWELNKNDFLEICLEEFIGEKNKIYANLEKTALLRKNISIRNPTEVKTLLWDKWEETYIPIWENFKRGNAFKLLQYQWKEEEKAYLEKIQAENNTLNEKNKIPLVEVKKDIWRKWIKKQATLIQQYKKEQWFKSLVEQIEDVSDEYKKEEIKGEIFVLNTKELKNRENNEELYKLDKHIFLIKAFTQIFMMVLEECIKEESPEKTELMLYNIIGKINKEKRQNVKSHKVENTYEKSKDHLVFNEMLEKDTHKYKDSFKKLMEGWTNKPGIDINSAYDKNKSHKSVEMTDKNFLNPNDDTFENHINYMRKE